MSITLDHPDVDTDIEQKFSNIIENEESVKDDDSDDHERLSHYVNKEDIIRSSMTGQPVYALCGKKWTPSKSPDGYQVCQTCRDIYDKMQDGE